MVLPHPFRNLLALALVSVGILPSAILAQARSGTAVQVSEFIYEKAPFPQCHASTIVQAADGTLVASFFGGEREKHPGVGIWVSRWVQGSWTAPVEVANGIQYRRGDGTLMRHPTWNPVLFQPRSGPLMLFYKDGPDPVSWWGMLMTSDDHGRTWSQPRRLPEGILGPIKNKPVQLSDGTLLCPSSTESADAGWQVHLELTTDLGRTWTRIGPINTKDEFNAIQPSVLTHQDGRLQLLCRSKENVITTSWSSDQGRTWSKMAATSLPNPNSGTDAVTLRDGRQLLVYNHSSRREGSWGGPRTPLNVAVSSDGLAWTEVAVLETDNANAGYSYPAVIQTADGRVHITYTWRRERIKHVVLELPRP